MLQLCARRGSARYRGAAERGRLTRDWDDTTKQSETDEFGRTLYAHSVEADRKVVEAVAAVAQERSVPRAQVALGWVLTRPDHNSDQT